MKTQDIPIATPLLAFCVSRRSLSLISSISKELRKLISQESCDSKPPPPQDFSESVRKRIRCTHTLRYWIGSATEGSTVFLRFRLRMESAELLDTVRDRCFESSFRPSPVSSSPCHRRRGASGLNASLSSTIVPPTKASGAHGVATNGVVYQGSNIPRVYAKRKETETEPVFLAAERFFFICYFKGGC